MATLQGAIDGIVVEEEITFSWTELCRACDDRGERLRTLVDEGLLVPAGEAPDDWVFGGDALRKARAALRLLRDLELSPAGAALVLELVSEIESLRSRLRLAELR